MGVQGKVRDRMEKFVVLPFSIGCVSQASVALAEQMPRRTKLEMQSPSLRDGEEEEDDDDDGGTKHSSRFLALPRPNLSTGVNRLVKGFKSLSQLFIYEDKMDELGMGMEIGTPTDVKHVTHIGWDSLANSNPRLMGWDMDIAPMLITQPTSAATATNLKQFEITTVPENDAPTIYGA